MTDIMTCPDPATLDRLLAGLVPEDRAAEMEEHLLGCGRCCQAVRELLAAGSDEGLASARAASDLFEDPAVIEVAERVATLRLPEQGAANRETIVPDADTTSDTWEVGQILDPPVSEGEIGRFGGYRVLRLLGGGGMGLVWEAEDPQLCRRVALKVMKPALADRREHRERFLREARAAAAIDHSHIVTVYQVGEHRGLPFLAMQLLRGETLGDVLSRVGRLPQEECLRIGRQMAEALAVAHRRGLIHRDIKPANTWLEADGGWVKLVDFGLAQVIADEGQLTQTGVILGTPAYMSPEQARGDALDPRSDLFSLGAVLYRMATGVGPFQGASTLAVLTSLALRVPEPPQRMNPQISPEFSDLIMRLLAKDPADRPASAEALVAAMGEIEAIASPKVARTLQSSSEALRRRAPLEEGGRLPPSRGAFRPPRWVLAAAAGALLLATIIIVIRNRHGEKVGEIHLPDGHTANVVDTDSPADRPTGAAATLRGGERPLVEDNRPPPSRSAGAILAPSDLPDPPPLDDWLQGRKILTVSRDGRGQFKTIQAALDAVQPGQAVEVLDRGPYRETLLVAELKDAGLVSRAGTVIEPAGKRRACFEGDTADFNSFSGADRFRLSGFSFLADDLPQVDRFSAWIQFAMAGDVLIERCRFAGGRPWMHELFVWWDGRKPGAICHLRECLFEMSANISISERDARPVAIIERNWFHSSPHRTLLSVDGPGGRVVLRHNVFDGDGDEQDALSLLKTDRIGRREICNNTMLARIFASEGLSPTGITMRNNLFREGLVVDNQEEGQALLEAAVEGWKVSNNEYAETPVRLDQFPRTTSDLVGTPTFLSGLSGNSIDANYLRIASDSDEARRGAGGAWPDYLGALPPGPAPKDGDWFTRLIENSSHKVVPMVRGGERPLVEDNRPSPPSPSAGATLAPSEVADPPPLDEWLKGRQVLTVSQDGKGQFDTIQAALEAVEPGQAVEVLDRGPYRELLAFGDKNDFGLISRVGTVIESGGTRKPRWATDPADFHNFNNIGRFRLSGLTFAPQADDLSQMKAGAPWLMLGASDEVVIENCHFMGGRPSEIEFLVYRRDDAVPGAVCTLRHCLFDTAIKIGVGEHQAEAEAVIERNWFRTPPQSMALHVGGPYRRAVVRYNVFDTPGKNALVLFETGGARRLEIYNNTLLGPLAFGTRDPGHNDVLCPANVAIFNNFFPAGFTCSEHARRTLAAAAMGWRRGNNGYAKPSDDPNHLPPTAADFIAEPRFLSREPNDAGYLRIAAESEEARRGKGGAWPEYVGALPAGPAPADGDWLTRLQKPR
jgi:serine/threonine protein kinase